MIHLLLFLWLDNIIYNIKIFLNTRNTKTKRKMVQFTNNQIHTYVWTPPVDGFITKKELLNAIEDVKLEKLLNETKIKRKPNSYEHILQTTIRL